MDNDKVLEMDKATYIYVNSVKGVNCDWILSARQITKNNHVEKGKILIFNHI